MRRRSFLKLLGLTPVAAIPTPKNDGFVPVPNRSMRPEEEHQFWRKGIVPAINSDDAHLRHVHAHREELEAEKPSRKLRRQARKHIEDHLRSIQILSEIEHQHLMEMAGRTGGGVGTGNREDLLDIITNVA